MKVAIFGAPSDTPNMGVSALFHSIVTNLCQSFENPEVLLFDNGLGCRKQTVETRLGPITIDCRGVRIGRRYDRPENLTMMHQLSKLGRFGVVLNSNLRVLAEIDVALDISGGDSFTDLYGPGRFKSVNLPKKICLHLGVPYILLPQTYGPFRDPSSKSAASKTAKGALSCWARDENSYSILRSLLGDRFDESRHRCGVDLAFGLEKADAAEKIPEAIRRKLTEKTEESPVAGLNISGLIYNNPEVARSNYNFKADYRRVCQLVVRWLVEEMNSTVILVPHVMSEHGHYESDSEACHDVLNSLDESLRERVYVSPTSLNQSEVKWLISQLDWFCGTRMHSTIAGLSSKVPTATISYSDKAKGVFETCDQSGQVFDPRSMETDEVVDATCSSFRARASTKTQLEVTIPRVLDTLGAQMREIAETMQGAGSGSVRLSR